ncbi:MAG: hypothetical protein CMN06_11695 [Roseibacillus sp.]|nr:hypothetical protein [Roseibacillus sp.]MBG70752.1 hypothetical protein [Roseibacillus sp.]
MYGSPSRFVVGAPEIMAKTHPFTLLFFFIGLCSTLAADDSETDSSKPIPIRYRVPDLMMVTWAEWPDDPAQQDVMARYIKSHGFNAVECEIHLLEMCRRNGLYARLGASNINELHKQAAGLRDDKSVFAYFISDRRRRNSFPGFANIARAFAEVDPNHPTIFINRAIWGEYYEFVDTVKPMILDYYHYHWDGRRYPDRRYIYLRSVCELARKNGIPAMRCVGAGVSLPQIRHTMYTSLAYGVQAFHFWPPWMFSYEKKDDKPVLVDGKIVPRVNVPPLAEVARDIQPLGPTLATLQSTGVYHTKPFHPEAPGAAEFPEDHWIQCPDEHLVLGMFKGTENRPYFLTVNADITRDRISHLTFHESVSLVERIDRKSGEWVKAYDPGGGKTTLAVKLPPGGGDLFRVTQAN